MDPGAASAKKAREAAGKAKPKDDVLERGQLSAWFGAVRGIPTEWLLKVDGLVTNASTAIRFLRGDHADLLLMDMAGELRSQGEAVNRGDLAAAERMLNAQAVSLNAIFGELARRAALNMGEHLGATERYMRLAFKAQAQCRATVETLAEMKNPHPFAFVKQANIANGPQQVNNGASVSNARAVAPAGEIQSEQSKRLEAPIGEWLDTPERRARQAELIRTWRPWEKSTGPRTKAGKARVARNPWKGGVREVLRDLARALRQKRCELP